MARGLSDKQRYGLERRFYDRMVKKLNAHGILSVYAKRKLYVQLPSDGRQVALSLHWCVFSNGETFGMAYVNDAVLGLQRVKDTELAQYLGDVL